MIRLTPLFVIIEINILGKFFMTLRILTTSIHRFSKTGKTFLALAAVLLQSGCSVFGFQSVEQPDYSVVTAAGSFELRQYEPKVVAETVVDADFRDAGRIAFKRLFGYISGDNRANIEISMTAPVLAEHPAQTGATKIAMTAPVTREPSVNGWRFAFVLPAEYEIGNAPLPNDDRIQLKRIPAKKVAVLRYSGLWRKSDFAENRMRLAEWIERSGLEAESPARVASYDPPWTLPSLRRNEVMIDIKS